jgi:hypothetical protein
MRFSVLARYALGIVAVLVLVTCFGDHMQQAGAVSRRAPKSLGGGPAPPPRETAPSLREIAPASTENMRRRDAVREAFVHSWTAYERFAWGHDELKPLTNTSNDVWGGFAVTMIDCLDTAKIMGLDAEFERMVAFLDTNFTMQRDHYVNVFELSIRVLGGLLGAFDLSGGDPRLLRMADEAGTALLGAFPKDGDGLPAAELNIVKAHRRNHPWAGSNLAEVGSVQLELGRLAAVLRAARGAVPPRLEAASRSISHVLRERSSNGLYPRGLAGSESYAINGGADSFYEYLLKVAAPLSPTSTQPHPEPPPPPSRPPSALTLHPHPPKLWLIGGRKEASLWRAYTAAVKGIDEGLVHHIRPTARQGQGPTVFVGELQGASEVNVMEHLACFAPGMIALGVARGAGQLSPDEAANHTRLATQLAETCWRLYADTLTGLAPDTIRFEPEEGT